jgi:hypothetical protein
MALNFAVCSISSFRISFLLGWSPEFFFSSVLVVISVLKY